NIPNARGFAFFFPSKKRHPRWPRDWSSDVCSSDLETSNPSTLWSVGSGGRVRFNCFVNCSRQWKGSTFPKNVVSPMTGDSRQPDGKFFRFAHAPARFPSFEEGILRDVFGFFPVLQHAVSNGEKCAAMCADDHFKCFSIAVNGRPILFAFIGIHWVDLKPRRLGARFGVKKF